MSFAIIEFKNKKGNNKIFDVLPIKWIYHFVASSHKKHDYQKSYMCFYEKDFNKKPPLKMGQAANICDGKICGNFYKIYVIKLYRKYYLILFTYRGVIARKNYSLSYFRFVKFFFLYFSHRISGPRLPFEWKNCWNTNQFNVFRV